MSHLTGTEKKSFKDFNIEEIRGHIIDQFCWIESFIDLLIVTYFEPKEDHLFRTTILSSHVIGIGGKVKILRNLSIPKNLIEQIHKLSSIRNGFAHGSIYDQINKDGANTVISIMSSKGIVTQRDPIELMDEFYELNKAIRPLLNAELEKIRKTE